VQRCCEKAEWSPASDLGYLVGDFDDQGLVSLALDRCGSCGGYRLRVETRKGREHLIPVAAERGDEMREADLAFWRSLRSWARS